MAIKINTGTVSATATQIANVNKKIKNDFSSVETAINNLNRSWDGNASDTAMSKFKSIKNTYYDNRYNVVNDMVNFMKKQVGEGYDNVEKAIVSAASAFK